MGESKGPRPSRLHGEEVVVGNSEEGSSTHVIRGDEGKGVKHGDHQGEDGGEEGINTTCSCIVGSKVLTSCERRVDAGISSGIARVHGRVSKLEVESVVGHQHVTVTHEVEGRELGVGEHDGSPVSEDGVKTVV